MPPFPDFDVAIVVPVTAETNGTSPQRLARQIDYTVKVRARSSAG